MPIVLSNEHEVLNIIKELNKNNIFLEGISILL